jgi:hypothetical protein
MLFALFALLIDIASEETEELVVIRLSPPACTSCSSTAERDFFFFVDHNLSFEYFCGFLEKFNLRSSLPLL